MLRAAVPEDVGPVGALAACMGCETAAADAVRLSLEGGAVRVTVSDEGGVNGFAVWSLVLDEAEIQYIAVSPECRRRGIASRLIDEIAARASVIFLEVREGNAPARALYKSCGFAEAGVRRAYYSDGENAVIMRKEINRGADTRH